MKSNKSRGYVDGFIGEVIYGWCACGETDRVALRINGRDVIHVRREIPREDVKFALDLTTDIVGFEAFIPRELRNGAAVNVEMLVISSKSITVVSSQIIEFPKSQQSSNRNIEHNSKRLKRAAVICWDLAHNPAGRALVLYNILEQEYDHVDLIGPIFPRFGTELWAPLQGLNLNVVTRQVVDFNDLLKFGDEISTVKYAMVWICKPRLPSILLGLRLAETSMCRVVLDIDDYEMSFFKDKKEKKLLGNVIDNLRDGNLHPADFEATAFAHSFIDNFRLKTVSNISLQRAFGGEIIPHGRLSERFNPDLFDKKSERKKLGLNLDSVVIGFVGTIRKHKGILEVARAVGMVKHPNVQLYVAGSYESEEIKRDIDSSSNSRAVLGGPVAFSNLPSVLSAFDIICLPQDVDSETSVFQLPAKIVDGLAMGLAVIVNDLPTYDDLTVHPSLIIKKSAESLESVIEAAIENRVNKKAIREKFNDHLSVESLAVRSTSFFNSVKETESIINIENVFEALHQRAIRGDAVEFVDSAKKKNTRDLVIIWKQIDSGLFGRRVDMIAKYIKLSGFYDRVIIIDAPITAWDFNQLAKKSMTPGLTNARLIFDNFVQKFYNKNITENICAKTFVTSENGEVVLGHRSGKKSDLKKAIASYFSEINLSQSADLLVYPIAPHLSDVVSSWNFNKIIVDLVDDEREFTSDIEVKNKKNELYIETLCIADTVFTNNVNMKKRFAPMSTKSIYVVPNGVERFDRSESGVLRLSNARPDAKIVGYLGNLRDRIDSDLLIRIADECQNIHLLLVGPTGGNRDIERLRFHPNISMAGARTYEESRRIAAGFDVGIIPHTQNALTDSMNPLKYFLYRELGIPVVTTPIKNLGRMDHNVYQSNGSHEDFLRLVNKACQGQVRSRAIWSRYHQKDDLWSTRVEEMLKVWKK